MPGVQQLAGAEQYASEVWRQELASRAACAMQYQYGIADFAAGIFLCLGTFLLKRSTELWWQAAAALVAVALLADAIR